MNNDVVIAALKVALAVLTFTCGALLIYARRITTDWHEAAERLERMQFTNKYAYLLGRTMEVKVYEGSKWERMVIVAVSWHGGVAVRPVRDPELKAHWIRKDLVPHRVREIEVGER